MLVFTTAIKMGHFHFDFWKSVPPALFDRFVEYAHSKKKTERTALVAIKFPPSDSERASYLAVCLRKPEIT